MELTKNLKQMRNLTQFLFGWRMFAFVFRLIKFFNLRFYKKFIKSHEHFKKTLYYISEVLQKKFKAEE